MLSQSVSKNSPYRVTFDENNQEVVFRGVMRPRTSEELAETNEVLYQALDKASGVLYLNFKRLKTLNNVAFKEIAGFLSAAISAQPKLHIKIITSGVVSWVTQKFELLSHLGENISIVEYDKDFYPGQDSIENESFIPVLRTQTKIIWEYERQLLPRHGLLEGMRIADICCGIGDFAVLLQRTFNPLEVVAVDHSKPSLNYARKVAREFGIMDIQYQYGDAASLLLDDNTFDFVCCRLSLQIFHEPELILRELKRICKPGGRVYLTNETFSRCFGYPRSESIAWTYREASRLFGQLGMDLEFGIKMKAYLVEAGFEDLQIEPMILTNQNTDVEDFVAVIRSWEDYIVGELAVNAGESEEFQQEMRRGFHNHIFAMTNSKGFAGWPIWAGSGRKV